MSNIVDFSGRRQLRDLSKEADGMLAQIKVAMLGNDPLLVQRVLNLRASELYAEHGAELARLEPVLRELLTLRSAFALLQKSDATSQDGVFALAVAASTLTDDPNLASEVLARVDDLRGRLPAIWSRLEAKYGPLKPEAATPNEA